MSNLVVLVDSFAVRDHNERMSATRDPDPAFAWGGYSRLSERVLERLPKQHTESQAKFHLFLTDSTATRPLVDTLPKPLWADVSLPGTVATPFYSKERVDTSMRFSVAIATQLALLEKTEDSVQDEDAVKRVVVVVSDVPALMYPIIAMASRHLQVYWAFPDVTERLGLMAQASDVNFIDLQKSVGRKSPLIRINHTRI